MQRFPYLICINFYQYYFLIKKYNNIDPLCSLLRGWHRSYMPCATKATGGHLLPKTSGANYFGTVWRREISLPRAHIIIISPTIYIFYPVSKGSFTFRKWPDERRRARYSFNWISFWPLRQGVRNYINLHDMPLLRK